jgi:hypothetical protein
VQTTADAVLCFQHDDAFHTESAQCVRSADPGGAAADDEYVRMHHGRG